MVSQTQISPQSESTFEGKVELLQFIEFQIDDWTTAAFEAAVVHEVLSIKAQNVVPVPNMPSSIFGLMSRRDRIYWVVDLAMMMGLQPLSNESDEYEIMILNVRNLLLAVAVPKVKGMITVSSSLVSTSIQSCPITLKSYAKGCMTLEQEESIGLPKVVYLLNAAAIARSGILHS
jgi:positive phototaxis protein PixI